MKLLTPENRAHVVLHTKIQKTFLELVAEADISAALDWLRTFKTYQELTYPEPVNVSWESDEDRFLLELSETPDFSNVRTVSGTGTEAELENLKIGQTYFWRVNGCAPFRFQTEAGFPRFIRIDGLVNIRDLGGEKIRQGLVYRGCAMNEAYSISETGKQMFSEILKIQTDLDLREEWFKRLEKSPAGENVRLIQIPYRSYREIFDPPYPAAIREIMEVFSDKDNYPVYFHCKAGADRTGMIALFLHAIAEERDELMHLDYELTSLSSHAYDYNEEGFRFRTADYYEEFLNMVAEYAPGEPLGIQLLAYLKACGVTDDCIRRIREILVK